MNSYTPDTWVILLFNSPSYGKIHKVFAGWYGGFAVIGNYWKLSSGISTFVDEGNFYSSLQESGSTYNLHKQSEKLSVYQHLVLKELNHQMENINGSILVVHSLDFIKEMKDDL